MPGFKGYLSDLGGPSANMYGMEGKNKKACAACKRPSCINPQVCPNLNTDHSKLLEIYRAVDALPYIKKSFIGSGVRYDLLLHRSKDENVNKAAREYTRELIANHVSGRLKVAPEHTCPAVLKLMRKPSFELFNEFKKVFEKISAEENLRQQSIPYCISSHPGCHEADMAELAVQTVETPAVAIAFTAAEETSAMFLAQLLLDAAPDTGKVLTLTVRYYINDVPVENFAPQQRLETGAHTLALFYPFASVEAGTVTRLSVRLVCAGGTVRIAPYGIKATVTGQGMASETPWDGTLECEETLLPIAIKERSIDV